jgi:hypothetical protein
MSLLHALNSHINLVYVGGGALSNPQCGNITIPLFSSQILFSFVLDKKVT